MSGCAAFAQVVGPTRIEAELLPQWWEQVQSVFIVGVYTGFSFAVKVIISEFSLDLCIIMFTAKQEQGVFLASCQNHIHSLLLRQFH